MIWPFRPHPPLPLKQKVTCERLYSLSGRLLGQHRISDDTIVTSQDIELLVANCEVDLLPQILFNFVASRLPLEGVQIEAGWASADSQLSFELMLNDAGMTEAIHFHPKLAKSPYDFTALVAMVAADTFVQTEQPPDALRHNVSQVLPLFFGFGPVMANAELHELSVGSIGPFEFGYCMALADWSFETGYSNVSSSLRLDAREGLANGLRYLQKTGDCSFDRDFLQHAPDTSVDHQKTRLESRSSSVRLSALTDVSESDEIQPELVDMLASMLRDREIEIQQLATETLGRCTDLSQDVHDELVILAEHGESGLRGPAISALRPGFNNDDAVQAYLSEVLGSGELNLAPVCCETLLKFEAPSDSLEDCLLTALGKMANSYETEDVLPGVQLLRQIDDDPRATIDKHFQDDPTAHTVLLEVLEFVTDEGTSDPNHPTP